MSNERRENVLLVEATTVHYYEEKRCWHAVEQDIYIYIYKDEQNTKTKTTNGHVILIDVQRLDSKPNLIYSSVKQGLLMSLDEDP